MAAPQYFFSTLAQASAAVVGFVVAVAAALYSLERQNVERRTDEYRDVLTDLRNRYGFALQTLASMLRGEGGETTSKMSDVTLRNEEIEKMAEAESEEYPVTTLFLAHIERILQLLTHVGPENDYILSADELEALRESINWYYDHFYQLDPVSKAFIKETTGKPYTEFENTAAITIFGDGGTIQGFNEFELKNWFKQREQIESEILRPNHDSEDETTNDEYLTGDNFWTLKTLSEYLANDFRKVSRESSGSIIRYKSGIRPVIKVSTYLIFIGVFLPATFLFSSSIVLPTWAILGSQIGLLFGTLLLSLTLVEMVLRSAEPSTQMGATENLSRYSSLVLKLLPDFPY